MNQVTTNSVIQPIRVQTTSLATSPEQKASLKLVCFQVERGSYAIAIERVKRITDLSGAYGLLSTGHSLMDSNGESITLINLSSLLRPATQTLMQSPSELPGTYSYVIVCQAAHHQLLGIPVEKMPQIRQVSEAALHPLPKLYRKSLNSDCVRALVRLPSTLPEQPDLLYLNLDRIG